MLKKALRAKLVAKPETAEEVAAFLAGALPLAVGEPLTVTWFALRVSPTEFAIFDAFEGDDGVDAHLSGPIAAALMANADRLLAEPPVIERMDVLAAKI